MQLCDHGRPELQRQTPAAGKPADLRAFFQGVPPTGLEPVTPSLGNLCSIHLSYEGIASRAARKNSRSHSEGQPTPRIRAVLAGALPFARRVVLFGGDAAQGVASDEQIERIVSLPHQQSRRAMLPERPRDLFESRGNRDRRGLGGLRT